MDFNEFAEKVKAKHPEYADRDNRVLAEATLNKFPEYKDRVTLDTPTQEKFIEPAVAKEAAKQTFKLAAKAPMNIAKDTLGLVAGTGEQLKQGLYDIPKAIAKAPAELAKTVVNNTSPDLSLSKYTKEQTGAMAEGIKNIVQNPLETVAKHPVSTYLTVQGVKGLAKSSIDFGGVTKALEKMGSKDVVKNIGLDDSTLSTLMKKGETPETSSVRIAKTLIEDKAIGNSANETFSNVKTITKDLGKSVGEMKKQVGESFIENPQEALNPIAEMIRKAETAATSEAKALGKTPSQIYSKLIKEADSKNGKLTFESVDKALDEVGDLLQRGSKEKKANNKVLYGKLAQLRDQIVQDYSKGIGDPKLRERYLAVNEKYSFYKRLEHGIVEEATSEALGKRQASSIKEAFQNFFQKLASKAVLTKPAPTAPVGQLKGFPLSQQGNNASVLSGIRQKIS